jgi:hypothetical protein
MMRKHHTAFALIVALLLGYQGYRLFVHQQGVPQTTAASGDTTTVGGIIGAWTISQSFTLEAGGFDGVSVQARPMGPRVAGQVLFEIFELDDARGARLHYRIVRDAREVVAGRSYHVTFPPIEPSKGRTFRLDVRVPNAPADGMIALVATRDDAYPAGRLFAGGREQWGDLVFATSARRATVASRLDDVLSFLPPGLRTWWVAGPALVAWNVLLIIACGIAIGAIGGRAESAEPTSSTAGATVNADVRFIGGGRPSGLLMRADADAYDRARTRFAVAAAWFAVIVAVLTGFAARPTPPPGWQVIDLRDRFLESEKTTELGRLHQAFAVTSYSISGERKPTLLEWPPSELRWTLQMPHRAVFKAHIAFAPETWTEPTDGATFYVEVVDGARIQLARLPLAPYIVPSQRGWFPVHVDLMRFGGRTVEFVLRTDPGGYNNPVRDACLWGSPRIIAPVDRTRRER